MSKWMVCLIAAWVTGVAAKEWTPCPKFLKAVSHVESSGGQFLVGDKGESLGEFQMSEAAWLDVSLWRKAKGLKVYPYTSVFNGYLNRVYAANYLTMLHGELRRKLKREPTAGEVYAAYNMGLSSFAECDFNLQRVNATTQAKCQQISRMLASVN